MAVWAAGGGGRRLALRSRVELFRGSGEWSAVRVDYNFDPAKSALIVCDMWDKHWCRGANVRVAALVKRLEPALEAARRKGVTIVHAPSDTMLFYASAPQRQRIRYPQLPLPKKSRSLRHRCPSTIFRMAAAIRWATRSTGHGPANIPV